MDLYAYDCERCHSVTFQSVTLKESPEQDQRYSQQQLEPCPSCRTTGTLRLVGTVKVKAIEA